MLTKKYRPKKLTELCGQDFVKEAIQAVVRAPEMSPNVYLFQGDHGVGKTTAARLMAYALNCTTDTKFKPCGDCDICNASLDGTAYYQEYDCSQYGSQEEILSLKDLMFLAVPIGARRVIVFDEFHLCSKTAQGSLLKVLEEIPQDVYVVLCTSNPDGVLAAVQGRAVTLWFTQVTDREMAHHLISIINREALDIDREIVRAIMVSSRGHVRTAVNLLALYQSIQDPQVFMTSLLDCRSACYEYLDTFNTPTAPNIVKEKIQSLCRYPSSQLKSEIDTLVTDLVRCYCTSAHLTRGKTEDPMIGEAVPCYEDHVLVSVQGSGETGLQEGFGPLGSGPVSTLSPSTTSQNHPDTSPCGALWNTAPLGTAPHPAHRESTVCPTGMTEISFPPPQESRKTLQGSGDPQGTSGVPAAHNAPGALRCGTKENPRDNEDPQGSLHSFGQAPDEAEHIANTLNTTASTIATATAVALVFGDSLQDLDSIHTDSGLDSYDTDPGDQEEESGSNLLAEEACGHQELPTSPLSAPLLKAPKSISRDPSQIIRAVRSNRWTTPSDLGSLTSKLGKDTLNLVTLLSQEWVRSGLSNPDMKEAVLWAVRSRFARSAAETATGSSRPTGRRLRGA